MSVSATQKFYKMHSLGNDFMVFDGVNRDFTPNKALIQTWGCRHTGIGFDQLLVIAPPENPDVDFNYRVFNADGSEAEQCGNGTRCVTALARTIGLTKKDHLVWQSLAGRFETEIGNGHISTTMTVPNLEHSTIPFDPSRAAATNRPHVYQLDVDDELYHVTPVSMGNPHAVLFVDNLFDLDVDRIGSALTDHPAFPERTNVEFCQIVDRQFLRMRVYERGIGETRACGTGACATVVAANLLELVNNRVKVSLPGGKLKLAWHGGATPVYMAGPSTFVYTGELDLP
jgi:diaminopimelate epimerase